MDPGSRSLRPLGRDDTQELPDEPQLAPMRWRGRPCSLGIVWVGAHAGQRRPDQPPTCGRAAWASVLMRR
jgi:hypothetical protein